jgi:hypothetical protein
MPVVQTWSLADRAEAASPVSGGITAAVPGLLELVDMDEADNNMSPPHGVNAPNGALWLAAGRQTLVRAPNRGRYCVVRLWLLTPSSSAGRRVQPLLAANVLQAHGNLALCQSEGVRWHEPTADLTSRLSADAASAATELLDSPVAPPLIDTSTPPSARVARRSSMGRRDSFAPPSAELTGQLQRSGTPASDAAPPLSVGSGALPV